ncbi:hypothetical protein BDW22DRAFT_1354602 [Trametopsis cervina]|nr:hypothetical protein BDW22DRAFT_1354602 [Trametopsis cervina]
MNLLVKISILAVFTAFLVSGTHAIPTNGGLYRRVFHPFNPLTNAQRLAQGLALKKPERRVPGVVYARASPTPTSNSLDPTPSSDTPSGPTESSSVSATPTPTESAPASSSDSASASSSDSTTPSATPSAPTSPSGPQPTPCSGTVIRGFIRATANDGSLDGFVSADTNSFGEFASTSSASQALIVTTCLEGSGPVELTMENAATTQTLLGFVKGFADTDDNLSPGSFNYAYLAAVSHTPVGPAQPVPNSFTSLPEPSESTVWLFDGSNLSAQWVNTDGTSLNPVILYVRGSDAFTITGDEAQFSATFGQSPAVTFSLVPLES